MNGIDWSLVRAFLAVVETGSLVAAAKRIGVTQPTLGRHIRELEAMLGLSLFTRSVRGLAPTAGALDLIDDARAMGRAAEALALKAQGRSEMASGTVRITASVMVANLLLPAIVARLRQAEPRIQIEIVASDGMQNLLRRDADVAIRMAAPTQSTLIARKLGEASIGLFGARAYVARHGRPDSVMDLLEHDVIGFDRSDAILHAYGENGVSVGRESFPVRCDDQMVAWNLLLAGAGIGFAQDLLAAGRPDLERIDLGMRLPTLPYWLVLHEDVRTNPRIRRVADWLGEALQRVLHAGRALDPGGG